MDESAFHYEEYDVVSRLCTWLSFGTIGIAVCSPGGEWLCFNYFDLWTVFPVTNITIL